MLVGQLRLKSKSKGMKKHRPQLEIERAIDAYVSQHPNGTPYHQSGWLAAIRQAYGHTGYWLVADEEGESGGIRGILPICEVKTPFSRKPGLASLPFCDIGGPLADTPELEQRLVNEARAQMPLQHVKGLEVRMPGCNPEIESGFTAQKVQMLAQLPESSEALIASYKPKLRSQIRKAEKNGLTGKLLEGPEGVEAFYHVYSANMKRLGSPAHSKEWFYSIARNYQGNLVIGLVYKETEVVGAGIVLFNGSNAVIPWASTLAEYNPLAPNMLLYWQLLAYACDRGCIQFDFGRSTYGEGTYRFKKQWGAEPQLLQWQRWGRNGQAESSAKAGTNGLGQKLRPLVEKAWQHLPQPITDSLGPRLRRYITL